MHPRTLRRARSLGAKLVAAGRGFRAATLIQVDIHVQYIVVGVYGMYLLWSFFFLFLLVGIDLIFFVSGGVSQRVAAVVLFLLLWSS